MRSYVCIIFMYNLDSTNFQRLIRSYLVQKFLTWHDIYVILILFSTVIITQSHLLKLLHCGKCAPFWEQKQIIYLRTRYGFIF